MFVLVLIYMISDHLCIYNYILIKMPSHPIMLDLFLGFYPKKVHLKKLIKWIWDAFFTLLSHKCLCFVSVIVAIPTLVILYVTQVWGLRNLSWIDASTVLLYAVAGWRIRTDLMRIRIRVQHFFQLRIRIQGLNDQKLGKKFKAGKN
jgi:hypothetical protein